MNVTVWNEHVDERRREEAARVYPDGIHAAIAAGLDDVGAVRTATLAEPDHGLPAHVLDATDVLPNAVRWACAPARPDVDTRESLRSPRGWFERG